jgi:hypothetical protein
LTATWQARASVFEFRADRRLPIIVFIEVVSLIEYVNEVAFGQLQTVKVTSANDCSSAVAAGGTSIRQCQ